MSEWISVDERLPDVEVSVLCLWSDGHHESATLECVDDSLWHCLDDGEMLQSDPTHWQPIPEPPK